MPLLIFIPSYQNWTFKFMVTSSSNNFFKYFFRQGVQVLQGPFIETNVTNSSFHPVKNHNWIKTVYILSTYRYVATNLTKVILFGLSSSKAEVSKLSRLS